MVDRNSKCKESACEKSCWQEAYEALQTEHPRLYAQLEESLATKLQSLPGAEISSQIARSILESKRQMLERDLPSPWRHRDETEKAKLRTAMDHILKAVTVFRDMGSAVAQIDPSHVGIAWIGVNLILQLVLSGTEQNSAALQGLAQISPIITRYAKVEEIYIEQRRTNHDLALSDDFRIHVVNLYTSILVYQGTIILNSKRSSIVQFARAVPKLDDWNQLLQGILKVDEECQKFTRIFDFEERTGQHWEIKDIMKQQDQQMEKALGQLDHIGEQSKLLVRSTERHENNEILDWVSAASPDNDHTRILEHGKLNNEYASSGQWLFCRPEFDSWISPDDDSQSVLWLAGPVGTGKSSLMCLIVEQYLKQSPFSRESADQIAFFYCSRKQGTEEASSPKAILRSLVRQLAWSPTTASVAPPVKELYRQWQLTQGRGGRQLLADDCVKLLTQLIASHSHTRIIIDALDECSDFDELLSYLDEIISASQGKVKFLLSSRMNVSVQHTFPQSTKMDIGLDSKVDIEFFIKTKVKQNQRRLAQCKALDLEDRLIKTLSDRAQGMFRWVELQLEVFFSSKSTIKRRDIFVRKLESLEAASGMPELDMVYDEIYRMNAPEPEDAAVVERTLKWIMCCQKPLSVDMLVEAASFDSSGEIDEAVDEDYILSICSNFIIIDHDNFVQFAHLSVREYLMSNPNHGYTTADAHTQAAKTSLCYLLAKDAGKSADPDQKDALLLYAALYWPFHCTRASPKKQNRQQLRELISKFLIPTQPHGAFTTCLEIWNNALQEIDTRELRSPLMASLNPSNSPVFTACAWGFRYVVEASISRGFDLNERNFEGNTVLSVAAESQNVKMVRLLLESGADPNAAGTRGGYAPLHYGYRSLEVVEVLIEYGADIRKAIHGPIDDGWTPLHLASCQELQDVVEFLLANGADVNVRAKRGSTALHLAALTGNIRIARLLLEHGALPDIENGAGEKPVQKAAAAGNEEMVQFLLTHQGLESDVEKWKQQAQFYNAVCEGDEDTVQALLDKGVDTTIKSVRGEYPFHWAVRRGRLGVASILLRNGADIDAKDKFDESALLFACKGNDEEVVNFLLDNGADINLENGRGREETTALSFATSRGRSELVELLLRRGADPQSVDLKALKRGMYVSPEEFEKALDIVRSKVVT